MEVKLGFDNKVVLDHTFLDKETHHLSIFVQGSDPWLELRSHFFSASNFGYGVGNGLQFKTPEKLANIMKGLEKEEYNDAMRAGNKYESTARDLYKEFNDVDVLEVGLAVPKFNTKISASSDGLVGDDGCIEIKCPKKMYYSYYNFTMEKMFKTHYDQIQGNMAIYNRKWCDYVIYGWEEETYFYKRINFDPNYWNNDLLPKINEFLKVHFPQP